MYMYVYMHMLGLREPMVLSALKYSDKSGLPEAACMEFKASFVSLLNDHRGRSILLMVGKARYMHIRVKVALTP